MTDPAPKVSADVPVFVTVTVWLELVDPTLVDENVGVLDENVGAVPTAESATESGLLGALLVNTRLAVRVPVVVGVNVTCTVQVPLAAIVVEEHPSDVTA